MEEAPASGAVATAAEASQSVGTDSQMASAGSTCLAGPDELLLMNYRSTSTKSMTLMQWRAHLPQSMADMCPAHSAK